VRFEFSRALCAAQNRALGYNVLVQANLLKIWKLLVGLRAGMKNSAVTEGISKNEGAIEQGDNDYCANGENACFFEACCPRQGIVRH
jgi:hypothetical protein